jgi:hypothetical protein
LFESRPEEGVDTEPTDLWDDSGWDEPPFDEEETSFA